MALLADDVGKGRTSLLWCFPIPAMEFGQGDAGVALLVWVNVTAVAVRPSVAGFG